MPKSPSISPASESADGKDHRARDPFTRRVWAQVSRTGLRNLWNLEGMSATVVLKRTANAFMGDDLLSRAAELGFYFLFSLFPMLICVSSALGFAVRNASSFVYEKLLHYLAMMVPPTAYKLVIDTFNETARASTTGKITLGLVAALWAASVGFAAIQDTMNLVYKVRETRPFWKARGQAILITILLSVIATLILTALFASDLLADRARMHIFDRSVRIASVIGVHALAATVSFALLMLIFSTIYYYAPNVQKKCWQWLSPGAAVGILTWMLASLGFRVYLHFFNSYSITYGSLGAVIVLLMWFYITGLTLLAGAEINSEILAAVVEKRLKESGALPPHASTDPQNPVPVGSS